MKHSREYWANKWDTKKTAFQAAHKDEVIDKIDTRTALALLKEYSKFSLYVNRNVTTVFGGKWKSHHIKEIHNAIRPYHHLVMSKPNEQAIYTMGALAQKIKNNVTSEVKLEGDLAKILDVIREKTNIVEFDDLLGVRESNPLYDNDGSDSAGNTMS